MSILIDTREDQPSITSLFETDPHLLNNVGLFEFKKLDLGDFLITRTDGSTILIEKKTVGDFSGSLYDDSSGNGSLKSKLQRMSLLADERGILIEGDYIRGADGKLLYYWNNKLAGTIPYSAFKSFLYHRQQEHVRVFWSRTLKETLYQLLVIHNDKGPSPNLKVHSWKQFLMMIPGISSKGADLIKEKYSSPKEALNDVENWPRMRLDVEKW